jgi:hypothetical protein
VRRRQRRPRIGDRAIDIGLADVAAPLAPVAVAVAVWERTDLEGDTRPQRRARRARRGRPRARRGGAPLEARRFNDQLGERAHRLHRARNRGRGSRRRRPTRRRPGGFHVAGSLQSKGGWADREPIPQGRPRASGRSTTLQPVLPVAQHQCRLRESHLLRHDFLPARWCPTKLPRRVDPGRHAALLGPFRGPWEVIGGTRMANRIRGSASRRDAGRSVQRREAAVGAWRRPAVRRSRPRGAKGLRRWCSRARARAARRPLRPDRRPAWLSRIRRITCRMRERSPPSAAPPSSWMCTPAKHRSTEASARTGEMTS